MRYYQRNIGDYARDAGHLTALEHGIYNLLLDWYYANERPIPADNAARIARSKQKDVDSVLCEFFQYDKVTHTYRHDRCEREIARCMEIIEAAKKAGKASAAKRKLNARSTSVQRPFNDRATNQ